MRYRIHRRKRLTAQWKADLVRVHRGELSFDDYAARHRMMLLKLIAPWSGSFRVSCDADDFYQEVLLAVWTAIQAWDPSRGASLPYFVRMRVREGMLANLARLRKIDKKDQRYLHHQIVENRLVRMPSLQSGSERFVAVSQSADLVDVVDAMARARRLVGSLPSRQGRLVAEYLSGTSPKVALRRIYGPEYKCPRKAALRAIAAAIEIVTAWHAIPNNEQTQETYAAPRKQQETGVLRPIRKVREPHAGEGHKGSCAG